MVNGYQPGIEPLTAQRDRIIDDMSRLGYITLGTQVNMALVLPSKEHLAFTVACERLIASVRAGKALSEDERDIMQFYHSELMVILKQSEPTHVDAQTQPQSQAVQDSP